jgi:hypothetical protein
MYPFHPRYGEIVLVQRRFAYRGVDLVAIPQPDGSVACIPEWMTHESAARFALSDEPQFSLENLRSLRVEVDALLSLSPVNRLGADGVRYPVSAERLSAGHLVADLLRSAISMRCTCARGGLR